MLSWRRSADGGDLTGLNSSELKAVAALWKKAGRELIARFDGSSMQPTIAPGTELVVRCTDHFPVGDVVVYVFLDQVVVHRLIARRRGWLLTRGDAHTIPDPPITDPEVLIGTVTGIRRAHGFEAVPPGPRSIARAAAVILTSIGGMIGVIGVRAVLRLLRIGSSLRRSGPAW